MVLLIKVSLPLYLVCNITDTVGQSMNLSRRCEPLLLRQLHTSTLALLLLITPACDSCTQVGENGQVEYSKLSVEQLIKLLEAPDSKQQVAATAELFRRGEAIVPALRQAGAKHVLSPDANVSVGNTRRLDMVYSLLVGLPENVPGLVRSYRPDSFGIHCNPGTTAEDVFIMAKKYGFQIAGDFRADARPNCYASVPPGTLVKVLIRLLSEEPKVATVNLNYVER